MSVSGVSANSFADYSGQSTIQQIIQEFQQLGKDLQAGNLTAAQADFVTLQQDLPQSSAAAATSAATATSSAATASSTTQSSDPIAQAFHQLSQDLQSGNLKAALEDYDTIQQDFQNQGAQDYASQGAQGAEGGQAAHWHHHHHDGGSGASSGTASSGSSGGSGQVGQLFNELGQELQSGNLSAAQQTYASLQKDFQGFGQDGADQTTESSSSSSSSISVSA
jgi:hypothetical protein